MSERTKLTDEHRMSWGVHKFKKLGEIPDDYWHWFLDQKWCDKYPDLVEYANLTVDDDDE